MIEKLFNEIGLWLSDFLIWMPGGLGYKLRQIVNHKRFARCGGNVTIAQGCHIRGFTNIKLGSNIGFGMNAQIYASGAGTESITIGDNVSMNSNVIINADMGGNIVIGNNVIIGPNVVVRASNHAFANTNIPIREQGHNAGSIIVNDDVWIGANAILLPNIKIGRGAIIAAGAVVTKNVDDYSIVAGIPARKIRNRLTVNERS